MRAGGRRGTREEGGLRRREKGLGVSDVASTRASCDCDGAESPCACARLRRCRTLCRRGGDCVYVDGRGLCRHLSLSLSDDMFQTPEPNQIAHQPSSLPPLPSLRPPSSPRGLVACAFLSSVLPKYTTLSSLLQDMSQGWEG